LDDDEKTVRNKIMKYAFSGGQATAELQRKLGGNPDVDVAFQLLYFFLEEDDKKIEEIRSEYKSGKMLTGELKELAAEKLVEFLKKHNERKEKAKGKQIEKFMYTGELAKKMWNNVYK
ncbi:MAG: tryptophan--tRNA ligase, partial [Candidatus Micrarchaeia archaeon]